MSSSDALQHHQLQMFMPAGELRNRIPDYPDDSGEKAAQRSLTESHVRRIRPGEVFGEEGKTLYESVRDEGVQEPVELLFTNLPGDTWPAENLEAARRDRRPILVEGHHRAASALDIDPTTEVPVTYDE